MRLQVCQRCGLDSDVVKFEKLHGDRKTPRKHCNSCRYILRKRKSETQDLLAPALKVLEKINSFPPAVLL